MTKRELEQQLELLRLEYKAASEPRKERILDEAKRLKIQIAQLCSSCHAHAMTEIHFPFCSAQCQDVYQKTQVAMPEDKPRKSIDEIKRLCAQRAKEAYLKKGKRV